MNYTTLLQPAGYYQTGYQCLLDVALDTVVFMGVEYATHHIADSSFFHNINASDVITFFIADGIFCFFIAQKIMGWFDMKEAPGMLTYVALKYGFVFGGIVVSDLIMHKSMNRLLGSLINLGLTAGVSQGGQYLLGGKLVEEMMLKKGKAEKKL